MSMERKVRPTALAPQQAVQEYLNTLLQDATAAAVELEAAPAPPVVVPTKPTPVAASPVPEPQSVQKVTVAPVEKPPTTLPTAEAAPAVVQEALPSDDGWKNGRPSWAQQRFECLLFKVSGLMLAVPLVELGGVLKLQEELTPLFGQPDWFMGLLPSKTEGTVKVIDTARWVMPERYEEKARDTLQYVVMMESSEWGLACHEVADAITLEPHQVNWRTDRGRRPWLAGTVIEHMCAIMDVAALVKLLKQQQRPARSQ